MSKSSESPKPKVLCFHGYNHNEKMAKSLVELRILHEFLGYVIPTDLYDGRSFDFENDLQ